MHPKLTCFERHRLRPPSSLDYRSTELIVSPKKLVGCRGGSRYVQRCWGFSSFQIFKCSIFKVPILKCFNCLNSQFLKLNTKITKFTISTFQISKMQICQIPSFYVSNFQNVQSHISKRLGHRPSNLVRISDSQI